MSRANIVHRGFSNLATLNRISSPEKKPCVEKPFLRDYQGNGTIRLRLTSVVRRVMANPSLRRFLRLDLTFAIAYHRFLDTKTITTSETSQANRNDIPEIMLARMRPTAHLRTKTPPSRFSFCDPLRTSAFPHGGLTPKRRLTSWVPAYIGIPE